MRARMRRPTTLVAIVPMMKMMSDRGEEAQAGNAPAEDLRVHRGEEIVDARPRTPTAARPWRSRERWTKSPVMNRTFIQLRKLPDISAR